MKFRPCIDLHKGKVKQIVGSTLNEDNPETLKENFVAERSSSYYAKIFRRDGLTGGHVIMLGPGNEAAAAEALSAWPGGLQVGGGINADNAGYWLDQGAAAVIVTSYVFRDGVIDEERLKALAGLVGRDRLVLDLSCRKRGGDYYIVTDRWQRFTDVIISSETLDYFSKYCFEFLIHAADVEGKCMGVEEDLVELLGRWTPVPATYAGGACSMKDLYLVKELGRDRLDITIGSALDIFGGKGVSYVEVVAFNAKQSDSGSGFVHEEPF
ncbi:MAG: phosphoribosylformimino-5-aminoimidazole carboxamide ribotide isomerase [Deltaproteobacteria bacterium]|nr:phosphoribosylformimino-5-aminoimidazole carboxamide ribotide isomerase [Deltaproteobacteria bacterium]MBW1946569.1 phosphoribosylformimino-5-aminoimidazole carboxamide ribotide isomerase [Deltaproteobacteria bacterium]MBW1966838.1 phosphoribosylformimino-5-aminoimidazole carboxamide ribotide isomerase [Deltaproteobacteria bacterium]MBW2097979.1 phosphoribosylformimino-5-aminoimidazole carboxamide ribotide isomerase [Deltaproteobacteria bacterium]